jgi:hypothetical protein
VVIFYQFTQEHADGMGKYFADETIAQHLPVFRKVLPNRIVFTYKLTHNLHRIHFAICHFGSNSRLLSGVVAI